jgi:hypothetical protein
MCDLTLTLKQARKADDSTWVRLDENQAKEAFRFFLRLLNNAVYGKAARRYEKRLKVLPALEKSAGGRWHIHAAIELPTHHTPVHFDGLIRQCWSQVDWSYDAIFVRDNANRAGLITCSSPRKNPSLSTGPIL